MTAPDVRVDPEIKALIPPLTEDEQARLELDLRARGCLDPLTVWSEGHVLLDGHHRLEICNRRAITFKIRRLSFEDRETAIAWTLDYQLGRRNLNDFQRAELVLKQKPFLARAAKRRQLDGAHKGGQASSGDKVVQNFTQPCEPDRVRTALAGRAGVSGPTLDKVEKVLATGTAALKEAARRGDVSIDAAAAVATLDPDRQNEVARKGPKAFISAARAVRHQVAKERKAARLDKLADQARADVPLPDRKYPVVLADPPWQYDRTVPDDREIENHYPTLTEEEICALQPPTTSDAVLFLWTTNPHLTQALRVMEAWGFTYKTNWVWVKDRQGLGVWGRQRHELVLIGTRGDMPAPMENRRPDSVVEAPRGEHSAKPAEVRDRIVGMFPGLPKLEMFARETVDGWDAWGNEVPL